MAMVNIYFNQWFTSISGVIEDIKSKLKDSIYIVASSKNANHAYKKYVDKFIVEDWECREDDPNFEDTYIEYVLNICIQNNVNIFFVRKYANIVSKNIERFNAVGIRVIVEKYSTLRLLDDKVLAYNKLLDTELNYIIPEYFAVNATRYGLELVVNSKLPAFDLNTHGYSAHSLFETLVNTSGYDNDYYKNNGYCIKKRTDEGGCSYREIDSKPVDYKSLAGYRVNKLSGHDAIRLIESLETADYGKIFIMEKLKTPEISVDCYSSNKGFIAICREKEGRTQRIFYNKQIRDICKNIAQKFELKYPFNVQFMNKEVDGKNELRLLEVNTRLSGGSHYYTLFDMNLAYICLLDIMDMPMYNIDKFIGFTDKHVTYIEKPIEL